MNHHEPKDCSMIVLQPPRLSAATISLGICPGLFAMAHIILDQLPTVFKLVLGLCPARVTWLSVQHGFQMSTDGFMMLNNG